MNKKIFVSILLLLCLSLVLVGCRGKSKGETNGETNPIPTVAPTEDLETESPEETEEEEYCVPAGIMKAHPNGANGNTGIYFTMEPNEVPADSSWSTEFRPASPSVIQLFRDGETYNVGNHLTGMVVKYSDTNYYLKTEEWINRNYFPLQNGDVLKIEGDFRNGTLGIRFTVDTTYILYDEGLVFFGTEYPDDSVGARVVNVGPFTEHVNGMNPNGFYACAPENRAPATDWSVEYKAISEDVIQLIRGGKTYNVGNPAAGRLIKYNETDYFIKMEQWIIKDLYPLRDGDIVKIEGKFANSSTGILMNVKRTYIAINQGMIAYSSEYPTELPTANEVEAGVMLKHPEKGWTSTAEEAGRLYFTMEPNDAPYSNEGVRFTPNAEANVKLIRNGKTYTVGHTGRETIVKISETGYIFEFWVLADHKPVRDGDILVVEGKFTNSATRTIINISKTYVAMNEGLAAFSTEYPTEMPKANVIDAGVMEKHPEKGWTSSAEDAGRLYFTMAPNDAPYDSNGVRFVPNEESCVKLIRDGVTYTVGHKARETIVKVTETNYIFEFWVLADHKPVKDGDILIVEGKFTNAASGTVINISKTYVAMNEGLAAFSTEYPTEMPKSNVIQAGVMEKHPEKGWASSATDAGRLYFTMAPNDAPYSGGGVRYVPNEEACVKLIRDGVTYTVGHKARETIVKVSETEYIFEFWVLADHKPVKNGDILLVEGKFTNAASGTVINISKTYVAMNDGLAAFSTEYPTEMPSTNAIQAGTMSSHANGWDPSNGIYFTMAPNEVPFNIDCSVRYKPMDAGNIKLIRGGTTYNVANPDAETIVKYSEDSYHLEFWPMTKYLPVTDGDVIVVEGNFLNPKNGVAFCIEKTYITVENGQLIFSTGNSFVIQAGTPESHPNGWNSGSNDGLYFSLSANDVPFNGWSVEYTPTSAANLKLTRDGQTYNIGIPGRGTVVKFNDTGYYLKLSAWTIGEYFPIVPGDVLILEGTYTNVDSGVTFNISKASITVGENYILTFNEEESQSDVILAGTMTAYTESWNYGKTGFYFSLAENAIPEDSDGVMEYMPVDSAAIKLIRGGQSIPIGMTDRGVIVKYQQNQYLLKLDKWTIGDSYPIAPGDILVIDGTFTNPTNGITFKINATSITVGEDYSLSFQDGAVEPELPCMKEHTSGWNTDIIYATMDENHAPFNTDWSLRYKPASADVIKLIRGGKTYEIANPEAETLLKYSETEYGIVTWMFGDKKPVAGDVFIIEGVFTHEESGASIEIGKTEITLHADGTATFVGHEEEEEPEEVVLELGHMTANSSGMTSAILYFSLADNDLPYSLTKSDFRPAEAGVIKLIRDGVTYEVGDPNAKTIVKQTAAGKYRLLRNALTMELQAGDILVIDGIFTGGNTDDEKVYTVRISKTYILIGEDGVTFSTEDPTEE